ncbi:MAG: hypothetical protein MK209_05080 [Planctomycetes bacterium]|nr:hypothetical protein [Planctomycetota bacterium]
MATGLPLLAALLLVLQQNTERVSLNNSGLEGSGASEAPAVSADGQIIAFQSAAPDLVSNDANDCRDILLRNMLLGKTELISVTTDGLQTSGDSMTPAISADGNLVVFSSIAPEFAAGDINQNWDIVLRDRTAGTSRVLSQINGLVGNSYSWTPVISADGQFVAFESGSSNFVDDLNEYSDIFVVEVVTGAIERISLSTAGDEGNGPSRLPSLSDDGRFVAFESEANSLVAGDNNDKRDIFVHDRQTGETERISKSGPGGEGNDHSSRPSISADGRFIAYESLASNLVAGDTNGVSDIFIYDRIAAKTKRISVASGGFQVENYNKFAAISADARYVIFQSASFDIAPDTVNGFLDVHVHDRSTNVTERVSSNVFGVESNGWSGTPAINEDGRYLCFFSYGDNLEPGDSNDVADVFRRDRGSQGNSIGLTGDLIVNLPGSLTLSFTGAPLVVDYWVLYSFSNSGSSVFGHPIDLSSPQVAGKGQTSATGSGGFTSNTIPPSLAGRAVYTEILARDLFGRWFDSNAFATDLR